MFQISLDDDGIARRFQVPTNIQKITSDVYDRWKRNSMDVGCYFIPHPFSTSEVFDMTMALAI